MAGICCGVVGEGETPTPIEPSSRPSGRRSLELLPLKYIADTPESSRKRQKLDLCVSPSPSQPRECENAVESSEPCVKEEPKENGVVFSPAKFELNSTATARSENEVVVEECPKYGVTSVCGRRRDMEDAVSVRPSFCEEKLGKPNRKGFNFFGVYDGHGCSHVNARSFFFFMSFCYNY